MRTILSMLLGILVSCLVAAGVVLLAQQLFPVPEMPTGQDPDASDPVPLAVLLTYPVAFTLGAFIGSAPAGRLARRKWQPVVMTVGSVMLVGAVVTLLQFPQPLWVWMVGVLAPVPAAWMGGIMTHNLAVR